MPDLRDRSKAPLDRPGSDFTHHGVTFRGSLAEWSLDTLAWLAAFLVESGSRNGFSGLLMFTTGHLGGPGSPLAEPCGRCMGVWPPPVPGPFARSDREALTQSSQMSRARVGPSRG